MSSHPEEEKKFNEEDRKGERFLSFSLGSEDYAIPLLIVKEVIAVPEVTPVPFTASHFLGVMNLRGQIISVVDLRIKLGINIQAAGPETSVIICNLTPLCLGFSVDSVHSVLSPQIGEISNKPDVQSGRNTDYIIGAFRHNEKMIMILDIARALNLENIQDLTHKKR